ncbi:MAG: hypothetical protein ACLP50_04605 [Solirubrobacteraceae bacterium]
MNTKKQPPAASTERAGIPFTASLREDPERLARMWAMSAAQRVTAAQQGHFTLAEMLRWAARFPSEPPLVEGDWFLHHPIPRRRPRRRRGAARTRVS